MSERRPALTWAQKPRIQASDHIGGNMGFIYHGVPKIMVGDTLHPLNALKHTMPEVYKAAHAKYEPIGDQHDRSWLTGRHIPLLGNCLWNDVLHTSAVHPSVLLFARTELGLPFEANCFQIDTRDLDQSLLAIYRYSQHPNNEELEFPADEFVPFSEEALLHSSRLSAETIAFWKMRQAQGKRTARYELVPHVLYRGSINVASARLVHVP